ncbi:hypothetical protein BKI52_28720 [marine bacterium AO1-C]|nr:hypothetical protein BKI52_28720 [marine bacterium AO1-C]
MIHYLNEDFARVNYYPQNNLVEVIWHKSNTNNQYRQTITAAYNVVVKYGANKWISDMRNGGVISIDNQKWLKEEMVPKAVRSGLRRVALVVSKDIFNLFYAKNIKNTLQESFQSKYFDDVEKAYQWLLEAHI